MWAIPTVHITKRPFASGGSATTKWSAPDWGIPGTRTAGLSYSFRVALLGGRRKATPRQRNTDNHHGREWTSSGGNNEIEPVLEAYRLGAAEGGKRLCASVLKNRLSGRMRQHSSGSVSLKTPTGPAKVRRNRGKRVYGHRLRSTAKIRLSA